MLLCARRGRVEELGCKGAWGVLRVYIQLGRPARFVGDTREGGRAAWGTEPYKYMVTAILRRL